MGSRELSVAHGSRLTNGLYRPHGVNGDGLVRKALHDELASNGGTLRGEKEDAALTYLLGILWQELEPKYDSSKSALSFATYSYRILRLRVRSWYRETLGDSRYGREQCSACKGEASRVKLCLTCEGTGKVGRPPSLDLNDDLVGRVADKRDRHGEVDWHVTRAV